VWGAINGRHREVSIMNILTTRRRLMTYAPAAAAMAVPAAAIAAPGLAAAFPDHLDPQQVRGLAVMLKRLEGLPSDEAHTVLKAITESIECSLDNHAHDAELMTLGPYLDEAYAESLRRENAERSDEEIDEAAEKLCTLIDKVLSYKPLTREGLKLQAKALIMDGLCDWQEPVANFVLYFGMGNELPDRLMVDLLTTAWSEGTDEKTDEEDEA
jgi:hypothetical protein